ncbi:SDR family oxidoreductase [Ekhidna sp.]|uniref:SDR family oxidoreductase n=1 Tax=Ekhidna sp. TaxID=2608089 RepID=UPI003BA8F2C3
MNVLIIGANGKIGTILANKLNGTPHQPVAMVRKEEQQKSFENKGIQTVLADLEKDFSHAFKGVNAVVFTAGSGTKTGKDKTHLIDRVGAKKAVDLAVKHRVDRFIMVSAFGADANADEWPESMVHYYEAKADADKHLMQSDLNYTILMPGSLTDENGTNTIEIGNKISQRGGSISRTDVATVIQKTLDNHNLIGRNLELLSGDTPIDDALSKI